MKRYDSIIGLVRAILYDANIAKCTDENAFITRFVKCAPFSFKTFDVKRIYYWHESSIVFFFS